MSSVVTLYGMKELTEPASAALAVDWLDKKQNIGIEIEVENEGDTVLNNRDSLLYWSTKPDGSLRLGTEFVLSRPQRGENLADAIAEFFANNTVFRSPTSGTHIHVDMRDPVSTFDVVKTMAAIMVCIEPAVFGVFAPGREWSGYTNPLSTMPRAAVAAAFSDTSGQDKFVNCFSPNTREYKYYGFNLLPLGRYGSVEFRYFNTAENSDELVEWVQFCMAVKLAAVAIGSVPALKYYLGNEQCWEEFLSRYFPQWRDRMIPFLPYDKVRHRYKTVRGMATPTIYGEQEMAVSDDNPLYNTRFKKFFAVRVTNRATGKARVVYDLGSAAAVNPPRVFYRTEDPVSGYNSMNEFNNYDVLVTDELVYFYHQGRWREWFYYRHNASNRSTVLGEVLRTVPTVAKASIVTSIRLRVAGVQQENCFDLSLANNGGLRFRMEGVLGLIERTIDVRAAEEQESEEAAIPAAEQTLTGRIAPPVFTR